MGSSSIELLDLPIEIIISISAYVATTPATYEQNAHLSKLAYKRLCLVNKQFSQIVMPVLWNSIQIGPIKQLRLLHTSIRRNSRNAMLVRSFFYICRHSMTESTKDFVPWLEPHNIDGVLLSDRDRLSFVLSKLTRVRSLSILGFTGQMDYGLMTHHIDCAENLEELRLSHSEIYPADIDQIFTQAKKLRALHLTVDFATLPWHSDVPTTKTKARVLSLRDAYIFANDSEQAKSSYKSKKIFGTPNHVIEGFLKCFENIEALDVFLPDGAFNDGNLDSILTELVERSRLRSLALSAPNLIGERRLGADFTRWQCLESLEISSTILWPVRDSWEIRQHLYETLPCTLKSLSIRFPCSISGENGLAPYDGAFHSHAMLAADWTILQNQITPASRYEWFLNLLNMRVDLADHSVPYLPTLESIELQDWGRYGERKVLDFEESRPRKPTWLPCNITTKFRERGIKVKINGKDQMVTCQGGRGSCRGQPARRGMSWRPHA